MKETTAVGIFAGVTGAIVLGHVINRLLDPALDRAQDKIESQFPQ